MTMQLTRATRRHTSVPHSRGCGTFDDLTCNNLRVGTRVRATWDERVWTITHCVQFVDGRSVEHAPRRDLGRLSGFEDEHGPYTGRVYRAVCERNWCWIAPYEIEEVESNEKLPG